ncbi:MAG: 30S ribosomal protein S2 [Patescibacteria group bacterium]
MGEAPTLREMLQAGVHFGHKTSRWHPAMAPFIFTARSGVHVINLEESAKRLKAASDFLAKLASEGKTALFVGTKKQASEIVKAAALDCGMPYVNSRWLGGTLTNFAVIRNSIDNFVKNKEIVLAGNSQGMTKRELTQLREKVAKGEQVYGGLVNLRKRPDALVLIGVHDEKNALAEAKMLGIPAVGLVDTNVDPTAVLYPVPANDDATKSIVLFANYFAQVIRENKGKAVEKQE